MFKPDKHFVNDDYEIYFDSSTGFEIMTGVNGKKDPFSLVLPSLLDVGVMGTCEHKCAFCYQGHLNQDNMALDDFKTIIDQIKHHTNQVALGGRGDPNLHPNFKEIIEYARQNNVVPNYTTSGMGLTDEHIEISKLCGAVAVSEYQSDFTYEALRRFMDAGVKTNIHIIFSQHTFDLCTKILYGYNPWERQTFGKKESRVNIQKLNAVIFLLFKPAGAGSELIGMRPTDYQFNRFSELIFESKAMFKVGMDSCLVNHVIRKTQPNQLQSLSIDTCEGARMSAYITPDMIMMPCSFADHDQWGIKINHGKKDINYIWNRSNKFKQFRSMLKKTKDRCPLGL